MSFTIVRNHISQIKADIIVISANPKPIIGGGTDSAVYEAAGVDDFQPMRDPETVLLIDSWIDQAAIDAHHSSPMMKQIAELREKYDLHMTVERFISDDYEDDKSFIRE